MKLARFYEGLVLFYLVVLLYLYPYGIVVGEGANFRAPDIIALLTLAFGTAALVLRGRLRWNSEFFKVAGPFMALEIVLPFVGGVGYRHPVDALSGVRMAMLWLPMLFLCLLVSSSAALRFERKLVKVLSVTLLLNLCYAIMQVASNLGYVPGALLVTNYLQPWAVDENYSIIEGLRPAGFFSNSTALSAFACVCVCFFYARFVANHARRDLRYALISVVLVVITTSRAASAATCAVLFAGWLRLPAGRKTTVVTMLVAGIGAVLLAIQETIGLETAFYRFTRLAQSGVLEDVSFGARVYRIWPAALAAARDYTFGTLVPATRALPLIDSGYLSYYLQGKWLFLAALAIFLVGHWYLGMRALLGDNGQRIGIMTLFLAIYLTGALVVSNPLRSPLVIFFIVYSLWRMRAARRSRLVVQRWDDRGPQAT